MDSGSSSVTSTDFDTDAIEQPLSPVLSTGKLKPFFHGRKFSKRKSRVKLTTKFNEGESTGTEAKQNQLKSIDVYKEQRKRYYDLLCNETVENIYNSPSPQKEYSSPAPTRHVHKPVHDDNKESMLGYHENANIVKFCTASGKNINISEESLIKGRNIFDNIVEIEGGKITNSALEYNSVFKKPCNTNKLSKIPILNQGRKSFIQAKATRSTYEEIQFNAKDITVTQTHVDTMEKFIEDDTNYDSYTSNEVSNMSDSLETSQVDTFTDSMNKIFLNKKFVEFSSSSVENTTHSDTIVGAGDIFTKHNKTKIGTENDVLTYNYKINNSPKPPSDFGMDDVLKRRYQQNLTYLANCKEDINKNIKSFLRENMSPPTREHSISPKRVENASSQESKNISPSKEGVCTSPSRIEILPHTQRLTWPLQMQRMHNMEQNPKFCNSRPCKIKYEDCQIQKHQNVVNDEANVSSTSSKNLVMVTLPPTIWGGQSSGRNLVEIHRNTNFIQSDDSVQQLDSKMPQSHSENTYKKCNLAGFTSQEQHQSKTMLDKIANAVGVVEYALKDQKIKKDENDKQKRETKDKSKNKKQKSINDASMVMTEGNFNDGDNKFMKIEKSRQRKTKLKDTYAINEKMTRSRTANAVQNNTVSKNFANKNEAIDYLVNQEKKSSIIVSEKCREVNRRKRKELSDISSSNCADLVSKGNENQTIELLPNQKKFKIEIDCNSKFRINISCNGENNDDKIETKTSSDKTEEKITICKGSREKNEKHESLETECENLKEGSALGSHCDLNILGPKGKPTRKEINKKMEKSTEQNKQKLDNLEPWDLETSIQVKDLNKNSPDSVRKCKKNESIIGSEPNYEELVTTSTNAKYENVTLKVEKVESKLNYYPDFCGLETEKFSQKVTKKLKQLYDMSNTEGNESKGQYFQNFIFKTASGKDINISEKAVSRAKRIHETTAESNFDTNENHCHGAYTTTKQFGQNVTTSEKDTIAPNMLRTSYKGEIDSPHLLVLSKCSEEELIQNVPATSEVYKKKDQCIQDRSYQEAHVLDQNVKNHEFVSKIPTFEEKHAKSNAEKFSVPKLDLQSFGFTSSSGKELKISVDPIRRARNMYENVSNESELPFEKKEIYDARLLNCGLINACPGKEVKISGEGTNTIKRTYKSGTTREYNSKELEFELEGKDKFEKPANFGFATASGKEVKITEEALNRAKKMYESVDKEDQKEMAIECENVNFSVPQNVGFASASGKEIKISEEATSGAKMMYEGVPREIKKENKFYCERNAKYNTFRNSEYSRSPPKEGKVSEETMNRVKKMYDSISKENRKETDLKSDRKDEYYIPQNFGFVCASGKKVKISEEAMNRAKNLCEKVSNTVDHVYDYISKDGKKTQSLIYNQKAEHMQRCDFMQPIGSVRLASSKATQIQHSGFQTASGGKIEVSSKALEKAKSIFDELTHQAGDYESIETICLPQETTSPNMSHQPKDLLNLCMGDFVQSTDTLAFEKSFDSDEVGGLTADVINSRILNSKTSKKAFELLEDVVETVDNALQNIDHKLQKPNLSISRKRLGASKFKPINISSEKVEAAELLFKEDIIKHGQSGKIIATPVRTARATSSTPLRSEITRSPLISPIFGTIKSATPIHKPRSPLTSLFSNHGVSSTIVIQQKTDGTIDDWFNAIDKEMESMQRQMRILEEKRSYLTYQREVLENNKKVTTSPHPGILIRRKEHIKLRLEDLKSNSNSAGILQFILDITPKNAKAVHFNSEGTGDLLHVYSTLDGALVVPNIQNLIGVTEIDLAFKAMPGVDPKLIPHGWIQNHYKLIVWKLASYERFLSIHLKGCLSVENIVQQLKYRYDREIDRAQRSALRRILEKDDTAQKRMILCVSDICETDANRKELELSDGWYCIKTIIDEALALQISQNKIKVGTKLVTAGAQIINCDGCHPLEVPDFVRLKIFYNSTRRAPWYAKMGYQVNPTPLLIPMESVKPDGGLIGCVKIYIARVYPLRFMEHVEDTKIWRNNKAEDKRAREFENERLIKMEKVHYNVQKQYEEEKYQEQKNAAKMKLNRSDIAKITCPNKLFTLLESSNDAESLMEYLSPSQRANVLEHRQTVCMQRQYEITQKISEEMERLKLAKRQVVSILKLLILDATSTFDKSYQFCIWNPSENDLSLLKECNTYYVYNILPRFNGELFSTNKTFFKLDKKISHHKFKRQLYPIAMLLDPYSHPPFNEFDTVGIVVNFNVTEFEHYLWLADFSGNLLYVKIRDGPKFCRLLDDVGKGDVVSILNIIYCKPQADYVTAYANQFTLVTKSMQCYLRESMDALKLQLPKDLAPFLKHCLAKIEKCLAKVDLKMKDADIAYLQCGLKLPASLSSVIDDSSEESSIIPQRLTATDIAMSLIDTDKFM